MPIQMCEENSGAILNIHVTGTLVRTDYGPFVAEFERFVQAHGKVRALFDMTGLDGWDAGAAWEDFKFDVKHFSDFDRLAMVGDKKWQHRLAVFFIPFTKAAARYFDRTDIGEARKWLTEA